MVRALQWRDDSFDVGGALWGTVAMFHGYLHISFRRRHCGERETLNRCINIYLYLIPNQNLLTMLNNQTQITQIQLDHSGSQPHHVAALIADEYPGCKGYLITHNEEQRKDDCCTINVLYDNEAVIIVCAPTEQLLEGEIHYCKSLNGHATCTSINSKGIFGQINDGYNAVLHFTF